MRTIHYNVGNMQEVLYLGRAQEI